MFGGREAADQSLFPLLLLIALATTAQTSRVVRPHALTIPSFRSDDHTAGVGAAAHLLPFISLHRLCLLVSLHHKCRLRLSRSRASVSKAETVGGKQDVPFLHHSNTVLKSLKNSSSLRSVAALIRASIDSSVALTRSLVVSCLKATYHLAGSDPTARTYARNPNRRSRFEDRRQSHAKLPSAPASSPSNDSDSRQ